MMRSGFWQLVLALGGLVLFAGGAQATGTGFGESGELDTILISGDGTLEFSDFQFRGIDPDEVTIDVLDDGLRFSGDVSLDRFGVDWFKISYSVRSLTDLQIIGTSLTLESQVDARNGAVVARKLITAPRESYGDSPWEHPRSWDDDHWDDDRWDDDHNRWNGFGGKLSGKGGRGLERIGTLVAYEIASGWICGCGHHHPRVEDVEDECRIERDSDEIGYAPRSLLHIEDTVKLLAAAGGGVHWGSLTNRYLVTPEPGTAALLALGLTGLVIIGRRRD
jgi:hypothetical protein